MLKFSQALSVLFVFLIFSCTSAPKKNREASQGHRQNTESLIQCKNPPKQQPLRLCFAGDIMAHSVNYRMKDFNLIYRDIQSLLSACDLAFANLETPLCDELPYQTFPNFNIHGEYAQAAIEAGFNVFSLANNHTNDQGKKGILSTADFFKSAHKEFVYSAGIKKTAGGPISYEVIHTQGWKVLFAAITEIVNIERHTDLFDFYPFNTNGKRTLKDELIRIQSEHPCDIFILSIHSADPEYVLEVTPKRREYFYSLLDLGVDIIWANHAHVSKPWERISCTVTENGEARKTEKLIMYGMGNTISGQNIPLNFDDPAHPYEYTGTGILLQVDVKQTVDSQKSAIQFADIKPHIIVTHIDKEYNFVIRRLEDDFIALQGKRLAAYYKKRLELMKKIREITTCR